MPEKARSAYLLLAALLPQVVLIGMNLNACFLMSGEMDNERRWLGGGLFVFELAILFAAIAVARDSIVKARPIPWLFNLGIFIPHAAYLALVTLAVGEGKVVPPPVALWIVPAGQLVFHQWLFVMPATFYSLLSLACFPTKSKRSHEVFLSLLVVVGIPVLAYLSLQILAELRLPAAFILSAVVCASLVCLGAFLRLMTCLYVWVDRGGWAGQALLAFSVGLAGPVAGLIVNRGIPFPADFQSWEIYTLAILNGLILLLPVTNRPVIDRCIWVARCVMLPFTVYFFLVFLPFLPFAVPAMVVFGAGFLILTPTALLVVHGRAILDALKMELRDGLGGKAVTLAVLAASILPAGFVIRANFDRNALAKAMEYVFTPDYRNDTRYPASLWATRNALESLRDQKNSAYRPFLSEYYDAVVFGGLTLATPKMQALHQAFFGKQLPIPAETSGMPSFRNRRQMATRTNVSALTLPREVKLEGVESTSRPEAGCTATTLKLTLQNISPSQSEYVTTIQVPPGVLVSGYWLHVGTERVPGQIFERKTALWVYQMIRDVTRQDPGILVYTSPTTLELKVFPFGANERRTTEIEFLSPAGVNAKVQIGDRAVVIDAESASAALVSGAKGSSVIMPAAVASSLPEVVRRPYLHFIVNRSAASSLSPDQAVEAMKRAARSFPEARGCLVTAANYEIGELTPSLLPLDRIESLKAKAGEWLPSRGAFLGERAIKQVLLQYHDRFTAASPDDPWFQCYPVIVVVGSAGQWEVSKADLSYFAALAPDTDRYWLSDEHGILSAERFGREALTAEPAAAKPVVILRAAGANAVAASGADDVMKLRFDRLVRPDEVAFYEPGRRAFEPLAGIMQLESGSRYAGGMKTWNAAEDLVFNPSVAQQRLPGLIKESRESGILVPASAYIVVENSAQWKILKQKEQAKLRGNKELDFMETPEPSVALVGVLAWLLWHPRRRRR